MKQNIKITADSFTDYYLNLKHNQLADILSIKSISEILGEMVTLKSSPIMDIVKHPHSLELEFKDFRIVIILYIGFEYEEYLKFKSVENVYFIYMDEVMNGVIEFRGIPLQFIHSKDFQEKVKEKKPMFMPEVLELIGEYSEK